MLVCVILCSCGGVLEAVRVARLGYPVRLVHTLFMTQYRCLLPKTFPPREGMQLDDVIILPVLAATLPKKHASVLAFLKKQSNLLTAFSFDHMHQLFNLRTVSIDYSVAHPLLSYPCAHTI